MAAPAGDGRAGAFHSAQGGLGGRGLFAGRLGIGLRDRLGRLGLLATQDIKGLVRWSNGLYDPPSQFVDW